MNILKVKLAKDSRVKLAFVSPGGDGLKILFELEKPFMSLKLFSDFYKIFSRSFAKQYQLEKYIDFATNDATRICFLSYDPNLYYHKMAQNVDADLYVSSFDFFAGLVL